MQLQILLHEVIEAQAILDRYEAPWKSDPRREHRPSGSDTQRSFDVGRILLRVA